MELRNAAQTGTAVQNLQTITQSQWSKEKLINQQNIAPHVQTIIAKNEKVLKQHSRYIKALMMCLMVLGALKAHFHCSLNQTASNNRHC